MLCSRLWCLGNDAQLGVHHNAELNFVHADVIGQWLEDGGKDHDIRRRFHVAARSD